MKTIEQKARGLVHDAKKSGQITQQPCRTCGDVRSQAHHYDYKEPLEVFWLCAKCHMTAHKFSRIFPDKFAVCKLVEETYWRGIPFDRAMDLVWIGASTR